MDRVDAMKKLQGWTDTSVLHFRNLGLFGEQILLGIRWGFWSDVQEPEQAFNWARLFRPQIQGYIHAYRAVAGVDLAAETVDTQVDATMPSTLLKRRLTAQQQRGALSDGRLHVGALSGVAAPERLARSLGGAHARPAVGPA